MENFVKINASSPTTLNIDNFNLTTPASQSLWSSTVNTGSNYSEQSLQVFNSGTEGKINIINSNGFRTFNVVADTTTITGSLQVGGGITGSLEGTASFATTASFALNGGGGSVDTGSFATTGSNVFSGSQTISGSLDVTGGITSSLEGTASFATTASFALNGGGGSVDTGSFATTGSNVFNGNQTVSGSIDVTGAVNNTPTVIDCLSTLSGSIDLSLNNSFIVNTDNSPSGLHLTFTNHVDGRQAMIAIVVTVADNQILTVSNAVFIPSPSGIGTEKGTKIGANVMMGMSVGGVFRIFVYSPAKT
jgi:hypothetical protein